MNKEIASVLKSKLINNDTIKYFDLIAGLVQTGIKHSGTEAQIVIKKMPISYDTNINGSCESQKEQILVPDSTKKGILYFEDQGLKFIENERGNNQIWRSKLRLVAWLNRNLIVGETYTEITSFVVTDVIDKLTNKGRVENIGQFNKFKVTPLQMPPQDNSIFSEYSYDEAITQYLRPPFEFFALDLVIDFGIHKSCLNSLILKEKKC